MFKVLRFLPSVPLVLSLAPAQDVTGDWLGTLVLPVGERHIALHVSKVDNSLKATLDSVEHGVTGAPLDSVNVADSRLAFKSNVFHFAYEGKVDTAVTSIEGTIEAEAGSAPLTFHRGTVAKVEHKRAKATDIDGNWSGTLNTRGQEQEYLFHIKNIDDGLIVAMDLPSQYIKDAESSSVERNGPSLAIEWKVFGSRFEGKIAEDLSAIEGMVMQAGQSFPFAMKRTRP
ncbi:MAG TPA: hypothetical protein VNV82_22115 [Bryobacteraceae bacterium]|jgi:hypothetical protein|nr:hypothetical protein [Bryobacteraceae bacterium]